MDAESIGGISLRSHRDHIFEWFWLVTLIHSKPPSTPIVILPSWSILSMGKDTVGGSLPISGMFYWLDWPD